MVGNSWWSEVRRSGEEPTIAPPRVVVSISGEPTPPESSIEWAGASGKPFDATDPPNGTTFVGRCVGKQLFISEADEKRKKVEALVKVTAPSVGDEEGKVIGLFPSKPIKVISKPSKKRQSAKNLERMWSLVLSYLFFASGANLRTIRSVHQSWLYRILVSSFAIADGINQIPLRLGVWVIVQRIRRSSFDGSRCPVQSDHSRVRSEDIQLG